MPTLKQWAVLGIGLFTSAGFFLGGIASFSGMVDTQPAQPDNPEQEVEIPEENFEPDGYGLTAEQMFMIGFEEDVAFVNGFYQDEEQKETLEQRFEDLPETYDNRVYVGLESNESQLATTYGVQEYPSALVVGGNQDNLPQPISAELEQVEQQICDSITELGPELAARC